MADMPDTDYDEQDTAEVFDEDNTNIESERHSDRGDAEQFEDLVDVFDATTAVGDADDDAAVIGEDLDDDEIVAAATDDDDGDLEDDDLVPRSPDQFHAEDDLDDVSDVDDEDPDGVDDIDAEDDDEVALEYSGDLNDVEGAESSAADLESDTPSDEDLRELDYKER